MICKFCGKETDKDYEVCSECEKSLTTAINKNIRNGFFINLNRNQ